jgi:hypothetical protein
VFVSPADCPGTLQPSLHLQKGNCFLQLCLEMNGCSSVIKRALYQLLYLESVSLEFAFPVSQPPYLLEISSLTLYLLDVLPWKLLLLEPRMSVFSPLMPPPPGLEMPPMTVSRRDLSNCRHGTSSSRPCTPTSLEHVEGEYEAYVTVMRILDQRTVQLA